MKRLNEFEIAKITTPVGNPDSGYVSVYPKSDDKFYYKTSTGEENPVNNLSWYVVTDYGADRTGVADSTTQIQATIAAASLTGGTVFIPWGIYKVTATLTVRVSDIAIIGEGRKSEIKATGDYGNVFDIAPTVEPTNGGEFSHHKLSDFYISTTVSRTSGYGIFTNWTEQLIVHNVYIGEIVRDGLIPKFYNGLSVQNQSNCAISGTIITARTYGIYVTGTSKPGNPFTGNNFDGLLSGNNIITGDPTYSSPTSVGVYIAGGTGGFQIEESNIAFFYNNIKVDKSFNGVINRELFINHAFASDNSDGAGIVIGADSLQLLQMTGGWSAGAGRGTGTPKHGIYIHDTNAALNTVITGGTFYANDGTGIYAGGGKISITGAQLWSNVTSDITLGANITQAAITGGRATAFTNNTAITVVVKGVYGLADNPVATGTIGGSIADNQVAFGNGSNAIEGNSTFTYDGANNLVVGTNFRVATNSGVIGELTAGTSVDSFTGGASLVFLASPAAPGTAKMQFGAFTSSWKSKIEIANGSEHVLLIPGNTGNVGIGQAATPTARLHLPAGAAGVAPLKLTSGTHLTTPEAGAIEFNGTHFYGTVGSTRYQLDQQGSVAGSNTEVQYNNSGVLGASANFAYDGTKVVIAGSTTSSTLTVGTLEVQGYGINNAWIGENVYFNGTNFVARASGPSCLFYFQGTEGQFRLAGSVTVGSTFTQVVPLKVNQSGSVSIGGDSSTVSGTFTGATALINSSGMSLGLNGAAPTAILHLKAGSATASTAPIKFTAGTLLTTKEAGTIEHVSGSFVLQSDALRLQGSANNRVTNQRVLYGATTDSATAVELTLDGAAGSGTTNRIVVPVDCAMSVTLNICVKQTASANSKQMLRQFLITNNAGTTTIEGTVSTLGTDVGSAALTTCTTTITANNTDDCIKIEVNGVAATALRWSAYVVTVETIY